MTQLELSKSAITQVIGALFADEITALRQGQSSQSSHDEQSSLLKGLTWQPSMKIMLPSQSADDSFPPPLVVDSFEWMAFATRVVNFFQLQSSGIEDYLLRSRTLGEWAEVVCKSRELASCDICFNTSGSTGRAKSFLHTWRTLLSEANFFADYLQRQVANPPQRIISLVPAHHIYGFLFSVVLPELLKVPVVRGLQSLSKVHGGQLAAGDLVISFPSACEQMVQKGVVFPRGVTLFCSTGPCPEHILEALKHNGLSHAVEIYGSTDTSGIGMRSATAMPYKLLPRWRCVGPDTLYDKELEHEVTLPDQLDWADDEFFRPQGRRDHAVSVNGVNVFPQRIATELMRHPQVLDARVRLLHDNDSRGLKALLVVSDTLQPEQATNLVADVHAWASRHLSAAELPKRYALSTSVPTNELGKEIDWDQLDSTG